MSQKQSIPNDYLWVTEYVRWGDTLYTPHRYIPLRLIRTENYDYSNESREDYRERLC